VRLSNPAAAAMESREAFRRHRQLENLGVERGERIGERVCDRRRRADGSALAYSAEAAHPTLRNRAFAEIQRFGHDAL
jgi:hypothetical protein